MQSAAGFTVLRVLAEAGDESLCVASRASSNGGGEVLLRTYGRGTLLAAKLVRNAHDLTCNLNVDGVLRPIEVHDEVDPPFIVLQAHRASSLRPAISFSNIESGRGIEIARQLTEVVGRLHNRGILHLAVNPYNVLYRSGANGRARGEVVLSGFGHAAAKVELEEKVDIADFPREFVPYLSPELTGRTRLIPDVRSDYYAIGATLYFLLTGTPPVPASDRSNLDEIIYVILTQNALPPSTLSRAVPAALSTLIMKLLSKDPDDRPQSAWEILRNLRACTSNGERASTRRAGRMRARGPIPAAPGAVGRDFLGRQQESQRLARAFARVQAGEFALVSVAGLPGIGKTSLVRQTLGPLAKPGGHLLAGKFSENSSAPYEAFVQACTGQVKKMLSRPDAEVTKWRGRLVRLLGEKTSELTGMLPELGRILVGYGEPSGPAGVFAESDRRRSLQRGVIALFRSWLGEESPIVLFLDDLQWADEASLELASRLAAAGLPGLLIIIAYRSNELSRNGTVAAAINTIEEHAPADCRVDIGPLPSRAVHLLVRRAAPGLSRVESAALQRYLDVRTGGNPLFITQQLEDLCDKRNLGFDFLRGRWRFEAPSEEAGSQSTDVALFLGSVMQNLPTDQKSILAVASQMNHGAPVSQISRLAGIDEERAEATLRQLARRHFVTAAADAANDAGDPDSEPWYRFAHDTIRAAASTLVPPAERAALHLRIGRLLRDLADASSRDGTLFEIAEHLNAAQECVADASERLEFASLDLEAGTKAMESGAFSAAWSFYSSGISFLPADCWQARYELALPLHQGAAGAAFLAGEWSSLERLVETTIRESRRFFDSVPAYETKIQWLMANNRLREAAGLSVEVASRLGVRHLEHRHPVVLAVQRLRARALLRRLNLERFRNRRMTDPAALASVRIMLRGLFPAATALPEVSLHLAVEAALITLSRGISAHAPCAFAALAMALVADGHIDEAYRAGELALRLLDMTDTTVTRTTTHMLFYFYVKPWKSHVRETLAPLKRAVEEGAASGEYEHAASAGHFFAHFCALSGSELARVDAEVAEVTRVIDNLRQERSSIGIRRHHQFVLNLLGRTGDAPPYLFSGPLFDETAMLPRLEAAGDSSAVAMLFTYKMILAYLFDEPKRAAQFGERAAALIPSVLGQSTVHQITFYHSLVLLALYRGSGIRERRRIRRIVRGYFRSLKRWAAGSPINFHHRYDLVRAEYFAALERPEATTKYRAAIDEAHASGYVQDEALAHARFAAFCAAEPDDTGYHEHARAAHALYRAWGALALVRHLEQRYPWLQEPGTPVPVARERPSLDLESLMAAARAISVETDADVLLEKALRVAVQYAGATSGALEIERDGGLTVSAECRIDDDGNIVVRRQPKDDEKLGGPIVTYVRRSREAIVTDSPAGERAALDLLHGSIDPAPRSVLCAPLVSRGRLAGLIYLENNLACGVFTAERRKAVELLAAQTVASFENASLYRLRDALAEQRERLLRADRLASLGTLTAGVSHEINNPNHVIRLNADLLQDSIGRLFSGFDEIEAAAGSPDSAERDDPLLRSTIGALREQIERSVQAVRQSSARIDAIVEQLKGFARGGSASAQQFVDLNAVVTSIVRLSDPLITKSTRKLSLKLSPTPMLLLGDFGKLQQLVLNLVENACQALPSRDRGIKIGTAHRKRGRTVVLVIDDEGEGIAPELLPRIVEPFFTTRHEKGGSGLGLTVCETIVREHGGSISFRSRKSSGTRVTVCFPAAP